MKKSAAVFFILMYISFGAFAHRLNEYLLASVIALSKNHVVLRMHLTAGEQVAAQVLKYIDKNGDGIISDAEQSRYVKQVQHDIKLSVDGKIISLRLHALSFPSVEDIKKGMGDILITYEGDFHSNKLNHQLSFENQHQKSMGVYLVNCLQPADENIRIISQNRNYNQSLYCLDFTGN